MLRRPRLPDDARVAAYIHGTAASEQARLRELNRLTNRAFVEFVAASPGAHVLEVGCGLGMLAVDVSASAPGVRVVGLEVSRAQLEHAVRSPRVAYVQGDAHDVPFADAGFDLVYARYLLEHVRDPLAVLRDIHRVVKPGGRVAAMENDISLVRFDPPCPAFDLVWDRFASLQQTLGGDPFIGRRLFRLLAEAGFRDVSLSVQSEVHWHGSPGWTAWVENIIGNVESARATLVRRGLATAADVDSAVGELRDLTDRRDGSATFVWNRAVCYRDGRA